jgi:serine/threonine-protein kinase RsbW
VTVPGGEIRVEVPAERAYLPVLRAAAGTTAMVRDLMVDDIADIKLTVDEVCTMLVDVAEPGTDLRLTMIPTDLTVTVTIDAISGGADLPAPESLGWQILTTLADSVTATVHAATDNGGSAAQRVTVTAVKQVLRKVMQ